jgi:hypothetical protein
MTLARYLISIGIVLTLCIGGIAYAQSTSDDAAKKYVPLTGIYGITDDLDAKTGEERLTKMVRNAFNLLIGFAGLAAVIMISYGAILYMSESITGKGKGREYMLNAVIGLMLVLFTYTIIFTINPAMLDIKLEIKDLNIFRSGTQVKPKPSLYEIPDTKQAKKDCVDASGLVIVPTPPDTAFKCQLGQRKATQEELACVTPTALHNGDINTIKCTGADTRDKANNLVYECDSTKGEYSVPTPVNKSVTKADGSKETLTWHVALCMGKKKLSAPSDTRYEDSTFVSGDGDYYIRQTAEYKSYKESCENAGGFLSPTEKIKVEGTAYIKSAAYVCKGDNRTSCTPACLK